MIQCGNRTETVSVERLKPAFMDPEEGIELAQPPERGGPPKPPQRPDSRNATRTHRSNACNFKSNDKTRAEQYNKQPSGLPAANLRTDKKRQTGGETPSQICNQHCSSLIVYFSTCVTPGWLSLGEGGSGQVSHVNNPVVI